MQNYFKQNKIKKKQEDAQTMFKIRSRILEVKANYNGKYETYECDLCNEEEETQEHLLKQRE